MATWEMASQDQDKSWKGSGSPQNPPDGRPSHEPEGQGHSANALWGWLAALPRGPELCSTSPTLCAEQQEATRRSCCSCII